MEVNENYFTFNHIRYRVEEVKENDRSKCSKCADENKELRQILYDICEGCLRGEVIFQDQRVCYDCPIEKFLTREEEK